MRLVFLVFALAVASAACAGSSSSSTPPSGSDPGAGNEPPPASTPSSPSTSRPSAPAPAPEPAGSAAPRQVSADPVEVEDVVDAELGKTYTVRFMATGFEGELLAGVDGDTDCIMAGGDDYCSFPGTREHTQTWPKAMITAGEEIEVTILSSSKPSTRKTARIRLGDQIITWNVTTRASE